MFPKSLTDESLASLVGKYVPERLTDEMEGGGPVGKSVPAALTDQMEEQAEWGKVFPRA